jgi:hypothetical protein
VCQFIRRRPVKFSFLLKSLLFNNIVNKYKVIHDMTAKPISSSPSNIRNVQRDRRNLMAASDRDVDPSMQHTAESVRPPFHGLHLPRASHLATFEGRDLAKRSAAWVQWLTRKNLRAAINARHVLPPRITIAGHCTNTDVPASRSRTEAGARLPASRYERTSAR